LARQDPSTSRAFPELHLMSLLNISHLHSAWTHFHLDRPVPFVRGGCCPFIWPDHWWNICFAMRQSPIYRVKSPPARGSPEIFLIRCKFFERSLSPRPLKLKAAFPSKLRKPLEFRPILGHIDRDSELHKIQSRLHHSNMENSSGEVKDSQTILSSLRRQCFIDWMNKRAVTQSLDPGRGRALLSSPADRSSLAERFPVSLRRLTPATTVYQLHPFITALA
jgi:hypothetical protein